MSNICVAVRKRPVGEGDKDIVVADGERKLLVNEPKVKYDMTKYTERHQFVFDQVMSEKANNREVYVRCAQPLIDTVFSRGNATCFAYGQTGSGKSHTMLGDKAGKGISSMALHDLFEGLKAEEAKGKTVKVFLEMLEIYNEQLRDLMVSRDAAPAKLSIRENEHGVFVHNAIRRPVKTAAECLASMEEEAKNRVVASTKMNEQSSRSHCLIRVIVEKSEFFDADSSDSDDEASGAGSPSVLRNPGRKLEKKVVSSMNLVDLAGSERVSKTGATGQRMIEGGHINKSLTCLTTVIHQLSEPAPKGGRRGAAPHVAFRDSKLTHLLKTALGGNSFTTVFCCITPAVQHVDESRSTLYFAQRAKAIKNQVTTNEVMDNKTRIRDLEAQVKRMRRMLVAADIYVWAKEILVRRAKESAQSGALAEAAATANEHVERLESLVQELTRENETLKEEQQQAAQYFGVPTGAAAAGGAAHADPMGGMMGFADSEEVARLKERLREMEEDLRLANDDRQGLIHANEELEEICSLAGRDVEEKEDALTAMRAKLRKAESEVQVLQSELSSKAAQLEQAAEQRRQQEVGMMERARGDELLERLTDAQSRNQELQLEYDTLIDMYSKIEIEAAADKEAAAEEVKELRRKLDHQKEEAAEHNALLWRFIAISNAAASGEAYDPADATAHHNQPVKSTRAEQALKSLELFVASRASRPPAVADASPQRSAGPSQTEGAGPSPAPTAASRGGGGSEVEALQAKVKELEAQLEISASRRDIIIDTKLKRMQDLVLRLHTTNTRLLDEVKGVTEENNALHDLIRRESKLAKAARKEGLEPANEALIKNRARFAPVPEPPHMHN
mmetsp:Transcript_37948/g.117272  ORF Transcript_37948/g.117272 Transcript_37948/m.117272 type:complete len:847 (-) Transcript_37948:75-2615(-)